MSEEDYADYERLETGLCVLGKDMGKFLIGGIKSGLGQYYSEETSKGLVSGKELSEKALKLFGKGMTRVQLMTSRRFLWEEGVDYYSATSGVNGGSRIFRYNLERCLGKLGKSLEAKGHFCTKDLLVESKCGKFENVHKFGNQK